MQPLVLCPGADEPWLWALLQLAPTPAAAARLREARLATLSCNRRLRQAVYHWARVSTQVEPLSRAHYTALRHRGHRHPRALRGVADRLLRVLITLLRTGTLYDATRRRTQHLAA